jgi:tripartite-type tricarboxylate transporter receptor subunit TctC
MLVVQIVARGRRLLRPRRNNEKGETMTRRHASVVLAATALCSAAAAALAQAPYPNRPIRFVVPYPPGGGTDFTAREIGQRITEALGQPVVIDNRPGAGATLGHGVAAKAAPDGYTLLLGTTGGMVSGPALGVKISYDPLKDLAPIGFVVHVPYTLVVSGALAANNVRELIELAKASPGKLNFGSPGTGTPNHLGGVMLMRLTGIQMVHIPYKGGGPLIVDLMAGQMHVAFSSPPQVLPHARSGRLKVIGVGHPTRIKFIPDLPAIAETVPGFTNTGWWGVLAPAGTPKQIVQVLNATINKALVSPEVVQRFQAHGVEAAPSTPSEFHEFIRVDQQRWGKVIQEAGIKVEVLP